MSRKRSTKSTTFIKEEFKVPEFKNELNISVHAEDENKENKMSLNDSSAAGMVDSQKEDNNAEPTETPLNETLSHEQPKLNSSEEENLNDQNLQPKEDNKAELQEEVVYKKNDIVWGKVIGYPFWPGKIINILTIDPMNTESPPTLKSKNRRKKINQTKDFIIQFFASPKEGHLDKKNLKPYDCPNKDEYKKKGEKDMALRKAIEEAEEAYSSKIAHDLTNGGVKNDQNLMSIDEELRLINGAVHSKDNGNNKDVEVESKDDKLDESIEATQPKTSTGKKAQRSSAVLANINFAASLKQKTQLQQERQRISQRSGKEFDEQFELDKKKLNVVRSIAMSLSQSSTETKKKSKKRSRSFDGNEKNLDDGLSDDKVEKNNLSLLEDKSTSQSTAAANPQSSKKRRTLQQKTKNSKVADAKPETPPKKPSTFTASLRDESRSCSPVNLSFELNNTANPLNNFYKNITFIINSNDTKNTNVNFICYVIESLNENYKISTDDRLKYTFYDIFNHKDACKQKSAELETSLKEKLENLNDKNFDVDFVNNLNNALSTDLVLSFVTLSNSDSREEEALYEESLFSSNINGVRYINLVPIGFNDILVYHYYFNHNNALFFEAPILIANSEHNLNIKNELANDSLNREIRMYVTTSHSSHYDLIRSILESIVYKNNIFFKELELGYPSAYVSSMHPLVSYNRIQSEKLFETARKFIINEELGIDDDDDKNLNGNNGTNGTSTSSKLNVKERILFSTLMNDNYSNVQEKISKQIKIDLAQTVEASIKRLKK